MWDNSRAVIKRRNIYKQLKKKKKTWPEGDIFLDEYE